MADLLLYLSCTLLGLLTGKTLKKHRKSLPWTGKAQTAVIMAIIVVMGVRMGTNREITAQLGEIGLCALLFTVLALVFTVLALFFARKVMKIDRFGRLKDEETAAVEGDKTVAPRGINKMTLMIVAAMAVGMLLGRFVKVLWGWEALFGKMITVGLCLLLFSIGLDLGTDDSGWKNIRAVGVRVLVIPVVTCVATLLAGLVGGLVLHMDPVQSLAVVSGMAWYTLAPGIIMDAGFLQTSAIAMLSNILREVFAFIFVPVVARRIGYIETVGMPGAAAMDVCLPVVERSTSAEVAVYSFVSGMILSLAVPFLVPLILSFA